MSKTFIIIPVYNEALRLNKDVFYSHLKENRLHNLVFANDGSSDESATILNQMKEEMPAQIHILHLAENQGKAEAIRQASKLIHSFKEVSYFGYFDADLASPLDQINHLLEGFNYNDELQIILGSRVQMMGYDIQRKRSRHYLGRIFATYVSLLFKLNIYDTQCGAKLFRATEANFKLFDSKFISRWFFDVEIILRHRNAIGITLFTKSLKEIPLQKWHEQGQSKLKWSDFILSPIQLHKIKGNYRK